MGSEWEICELRNCATWYSGGTPSKSNPNYWNGNIPWISAKSLTGFFIQDSEDKVTELGVENGTRLVPENTILFIVRGMSLKTEFRMGITSKPVTFNQDLKALVPHNHINPKFLAYAIKGRTNEILDFVGEAGHGTGVLPTDRIQKLKILLPPINEQWTIAHILGTLDDKIELNRQMNETLEAMAQALFKAWFVDFEPVRAKMEGRWKRGDSLPGLPAHLYDLFPDQLVNSELGEIPEGWQLYPLDSIAKYLNGLALQKFPPESEYEFLPVIKIAQLRAGHTNKADKTSAYISSEYVIENGDVLFSWSGSLEVEVWTGGRGALNQHLFKVTSELVPKWFYFFATRYHLKKFREIAAGKATTMGHIQRKHLTDALIAVAPLNDLTKFDLIIGSLFHQFTCKFQESYSLAELRDTLLLRLISGELRIQDAEILVNERIT